MTTDEGHWDDRSLSPASPLKFNYRRIVGGTRLLLTEASPWKLLFQDRIQAQKARLVEEVGSWSGVEPAPHRFGGTEFLVDGREIGHVHEWGLFDAPLARPIGDAVVDAGEAGNHHILPDSGWVTTFVEDDPGREHARELLRLSYCWHVAKYDPDGVEMGRAGVEREVESLSLDDSVLGTFLEALDARTA